MSPTDAPRYSLIELARLAGVTPRTVRYYMSQGLLPSPGASGPGVKYDDAHLGRLRLIRKLQREHLPLADIRGRLEGLDDATIAILAEAPADEPGPRDSALDYIRRVLGSSAAGSTATADTGMAGSPVAAATPMRLPAFAAEPIARIHASRAPHPPPSAPSAATESSVGAGAPPPAAPPLGAPLTLGVEQGSDRRFERSQWERIPLAPDIELHVRRPLPRPLAKQVDRLVSIARDLLEEEPS